jgi:very-short-patch-repair endonuclease
VRGGGIGRDRWAKPMRGLRLLETRRARELRRLSPAAELILWARLKNRGLQGAKFVRSEPIGPYIADFACRSAKLVVEIDGATHSTDEEIAHDGRRTAFLEAESYRVVRFSNAQVFENVEAVVNEIACTLAERAP